MTAAAVHPIVLATDSGDLRVAAGRVLMLAGAAFGLANLFQYGVQSGGLGLHPAVLGLSWPVALAVFFIGLGRLRRTSGNAGRRVARWSRLAIGATMLTAIGLMAASAATGNAALMLWTTPAGLCVYGVGWATAFVRGGHRWMLAPCIGALGAAGATIPVLGSPMQYLAYAVGLLAFVLAPGAWMALARNP